jgi:23S rRNA pseudouridine1911/1915/1917 synthase
MYRVYHALVSGGFSEDEGVVDLPIGRHPRDRKKMAVVAGGREARTHYRVLARYGQVSYLSLRLETGRTHQIRVHMSSKGHPLLGDSVYGGGNTPFERRHASLLSGQCLHAKELSFTHPRTGERMTFTSPLPDDFVRLLDILDAEQ